MGGRGTAPGLRRRLRAEAASDFRVRRVQPPRAGDLSRARFTNPVTHGYGSTKPNPAPPDSLIRDIDPDPGRPPTPRTGPHTATCTPRSRKPRSRDLSQALIFAAAIVGQREGQVAATDGLRATSRRCLRLVPGETASTMELRVVRPGTHVPSPGWRVGPNICRRVGVACGYDGEGHGSAGAAGGVATGCGAGGPAGRAGPVRCAGRA